MCGNLSNYVLLVTFYSFVTISALLKKRQFQEKFNKSCAMFDKMLSSKVEFPASPLQPTDLTVTYPSVTKKDLSMEPSVTIEPVPFEPKPVPSLDMEVKSKPERTAPSPLSRLPQPPPRIPPDVKAFIDDRTVLHPSSPPMLRVNHHPIPTLSTSYHHHHHHHRQHNHRQSPHRQIHALERPPMLDQVGTLDLSIDHGRGLSSVPSGMRSLNEPTSEPADLSNRRPENLTCVPEIGFIKEEINDAASDYSNSSDPERLEVDMSQVMPFSNLHYRLPSSKLCTKFIYLTHTGSWRPF